MEFKLQPIIKWPGGKEKELKYILPKIPTFHRYFEPFVGGGSVFMSIDAKEYHINDLSYELICLYKNIASHNDIFYHYVDLIDSSWKNADIFFRANLVLVDKYLEFRTGLITQDELKYFVHSFCIHNELSIYEIVGSELFNLSSTLIHEMETNITRKMIRMKRLEKDKYLLPEVDIHNNIIAAIKSALYANYRYLYNSSLIKENNTNLHQALFVFIRNYAYSGMFRYSRKGEFNVPYGGIAYNNKFMTKKIEYYKSKAILEHFANTTICNCDFEKFLQKYRLTEDDFIFLDPPYDTEFNTYDRNSFTKDDQIRLANYLINHCRAKWMLIIKNTDFIYNLYNNTNVNICSFDKEYIVSFMNRNNKKATHLIITNY